MKYEVSNLRLIANNDLASLKTVKRQLEFHLKVISDRIDGYVMSTCYICETYELGYESLPPGWTWKAERILCDKCLEKFKGVNIENCNI